MTDGHKSKPIKRSLAQSDWFRPEAPDPNLSQSEHRTAQLTVTGPCLSQSEPNTAQPIMIRVKLKPKHIGGGEVPQAKASECHMELAQIKAHDPGPNNLEYHILLTIDGPSLNHPQDFSQSYCKRGLLFPTVLELERA